MADDPLIEVVEVDAAGHRRPQPVVRGRRATAPVLVVALLALGGLGALVATRDGPSSPDPIPEGGESIGTTVTGELIWFAEERVVRLVAGDDAEVIAIGGPFVGGDGWLATVVCDNPTPDCSVDAYEPDLGESWSVRVPIGWSVVQALDRRAVFARGGEVEGALLLDIDAREVRPLDVPSPDGATFAVSGRYLVYPATGSQEAGRCAIDLEREEFECSVQGFPFSGVLEPPFGGGG